MSNFSDCGKNVMMAQWRWIAKNSFWINWMSFGGNWCGIFIKILVWLSAATMPPTVPRHRALMYWIWQERLTQQEWRDRTCGEWKCEENGRSGSSIYDRSRFTKINTYKKREMFLNKNKTLISKVNRGRWQKMMRTPVEDKKYSESQVHVHHHQQQHPTTTSMLSEISLGHFREYSAIGV